MKARTGRAVGFIAVVLLAAASAPVRAEVTPQEITFGMVAPFSGPEKDLGRRVRVGLEVAFAAVNEAGGVHGRALKLVAVDDGGEPSRTVAAMKDLVEKRKVFGFVGNVGTATAAVALPLVNDKGILFFGAITGSALLRQRPPDRYVFNVRASYAEETAAMLRYLVTVKRVPPAAIAVFAQDDAFGEAGFEGVAKALRQLGHDPARVVRVQYKRNTVDVAEAARKIQQSAKSLRAVIMIATYKPAARFIEALRDAGVRNLIFTNVSDVGTDEMADELAQLGPGYADGVLVTQVVPLPTASATPLIRYRDALKKYAPGEKPGFLSLESWISAQLLIEGLQRAGRDLTSDGIVNALEAVRGFDLGVGTPFNLGPSEHQASHLVWGTVLDAKGTARPVALE